MKTRHRINPQSGASSVGAIFVSMLVVVAFILVLVGPLGMTIDSTGIRRPSPSPDASLEGSIPPSPLTIATTQPVPTDSGPTSFADMFATYADGIVRIQNTTCSGSATGSGALIAPNLVITAAHVVEGHSNLKVVSTDQVVSGEVVGYAIEDDVALVRTSSPMAGHVLQVADQNAPVGTELAALGYPRSGPLSLAGPGVVSAYGLTVTYNLGDELVEVADLMRMTVPTNPGNSGGPLVDVSGRIVGLVSGTDRVTYIEDGGETDVDVPQGMNYAVTAETVSRLVDAWRITEATYAPSDCGLTPPDDEELVTALTDSEDTDLVVAMLFDYFDGVNTSDYERAYQQLSAERRAGETLEEFTAPLITSIVSDVVVLDVVRDGDSLVADVTFTSEQAETFGPDGLECAIWRLQYDLVPGGTHGWSIARTTQVGDYPKYQSCRL